MALSPKRPSGDRVAKLVEEVTQEPTKRLNADIPLRLMKALKIQAANEGRKQREILCDALEAYLAQNQK